MAVIYNNIVQSETEPSTNSLWLKDGKLKIYKNGWQDIAGGFTNKEEFESQVQQVVEKLIVEKLNTEH